ncbi:MAG: Zn-ribbon domain-containing OB-fold protein [Acidimicrobiales bacterium]
MSEARPPVGRPAPVPDPESAEFWRGGLDGRLLVQRCDTCGHFQFYPRAHCLLCRGAVGWVEASGRGTIYSFTVIRQNFARPFRDQLPYVVALVDLEEGPRMMTNIVDVDPDEVRIGAPVQVRFEPVSEEAAVPLFALVKE